MRFVCDSCRAQYMISDEKVGPKGVKVRCKKCSYVILVKKSDGGAKSPVSSVGADADDALATQVMQNPLTGPGDTQADRGAPDFGDEKTAAGGPNAGGAGAGGFFSGVDEDEIGAVFDQVLSSGPHTLPRGDEKKAAKAESSALGDDADDRLSTRVMDAATVNQLATESGDSEAPISGEAVDRAGNGADATPEWFAAIDEKQTGPLSIEKLKEHWNRGEVGPDSLAWKAGMPDWIPISDIPELSAELAPRPKQPVLIAPTPAVSAPGAVMNIPVESAFSAGAGLSMSGGGGMQQVPLGTGEEVASWRPSAASALASLVKEEMDALAKPGSSMSSDAAVATGGGMGGLLDLPHDEAPSAPAPRTNGHSDTGAANGRGAGAANPYNGSSAATYSSPAIQQYRPPPEKQNNTLYAIIGVGAVIALLLGVGIYVLKPGPAPQTVIVQAPPAPTPTPTPAPVAVQPPPTPTPAPVVQPGATPTPAPVAQAQGQTVAPTPVAPQPVAPRPTSQGGFKKSESSERAEKPEKRSAKEEKTVDAPSTTKKGGKEEPDDFEKEFGGSEKGSGKAAPKKKDEAEAQSEPKRGGGYIPPAPGQANLPETLQGSDVVQVVLENKAALQACAAEHRKKDPSAPAKLAITMQWTILTSGKTTAVSVASDDMKGSVLGTCLGQAIKTWSFPKHKKQGDPIKFPFKL